MAGKPYKTGIIPLYSAFLRGTGERVFQKGRVQKKAAFSAPCL